MMNTYRTDLLSRFRYDDLIGERGRKEIGNNKNIISNAPNNFVIVSIFMR